MRSALQNEDMTIILGYNTAVDYWRSCALIPERKVWRGFLGDSNLRKSATTNALNATDDPAAKASAQKYLESAPNSHLILVGKRSSHQLPFSSVHTHKNIPPRSFMSSNSLSTEDQVFVSVPEFCFLQMANILPLEKLIAYGFEICGTYARHTQGTFFGARPLTTPRKLTEFLSRASGFQGIQKARRALRCILPRSASPMESALTMLLCLPYSLGGYGISQPKLNQRIDIPQQAKKRSYSPFYVCDLYWEQAALAIEYDSDFAHAGLNKTVKDAMRRSDLTGIGISVLSVTWAQLLDSRALNDIAHIIARHTGKRLRYVDPAFTQKHQHLRSLILPLYLNHA